MKDTDKAAAAVIIPAGMVLGALVHIGLLSTMGALIALGSGAAAMGLISGLYGDGTDSDEEPGENGEVVEA